MIKQIPNVITLGNLMCGFIAISLNDIYWSPLLILLGAFLDMFDGMAARMLKVDGKFGLQLDTLADMVNFGIAPAFLYWHHMLDGSWISYVVIAFLPVFGAWRLAAFNISTDQSDHFKGLAIPSAGMFIAFFVFASNEMTSMNLIFNHPAVIYSVPIFIGLIMISPIDMFSLKGFSKKGNEEKILLGILVGVGLFSIVVFGFSAIPLIVLTYIILSILGNVFKWI